MNKLYVLTGPAGVGKSTISKAIANILPKSVLIEGDDIYNFFVGGWIEPWNPNAPEKLFWDNCIYLLNSYLEAGYDVVFNYIIEPEKFEILKEKFSKYELIFKVLIVDEKTIIDRDNERPEDCRMGERSLILLRDFIKASYDKKLILDTSKLTIEETVKRIIK